MTKKELKEVKMVNLSVGRIGKKNTWEAIYDYIKPIIVENVKKFFRWCHRGLTWLENKALKKIDEFGKKMGKKLEERTE